MNADLLSNIPIALAGALATLIVGGLATWHSRKALRIQLEQLELAREEAERERQDAQKAREDCQRKADSYVRQYEEASKRFTKLLGDLIDQAVKAANVNGPTSQELLIAARSLVKARNDLRSSLEAIQARLNSSIDSLHREVERKPPSAGEIESIVKVLQNTWPAKNAEIDLAVRKVLADMGLEPLRA